MRSHDFRLRKCTVAVIFALGTDFYGIFLGHKNVKLAEFICHIEYFSNFVLGEHSDYCLYYFVIEHYKGIKISLTTQFIDNYISSNSRYNSINYNWVLDYGFSSDVISILHKYDYYTNSPAVCGWREDSFNST